MADIDITGGETARELRAEMAEHEHEHAERDAAAQSEEAEERAARAFEFKTQTLSHEEYIDMVARILRAAEHGREEIVAMRFPATLCSDHGRAIGAAEPDWPETLPLKARSFVDHWEQQEKAMGYHLKAQILDYPGGLPGDVGLILDWRPEEASE